MVKTGTVSEAPSDYEIRAKALECASILLSNHGGSVDWRILELVLRRNEIYLRGEAE